MLLVLQMFRILRIFESLIFRYNKIIIIVIIFIIIKIFRTNGKRILIEKIK